MRNDKHIAIQLREKGKSYKEISKELDIPLSTLSDWFSKATWSKIIRKDLEKKIGNKLSIAGKKRWLRWHEKFREEARNEYPKLYKDPLFIAGIMLYWGEGDNNRLYSAVRLSNTDPNMMRLFTTFLIQTCHVPVEKVRAQLYLYPDLNEKKCMDFWTQSTGLAPSHFFKAAYIYGRHPTKRLTYGICQVRYSNRALKERILVWINMFQKTYPGTFNS